MSGKTTPTLGLLTLLLIVSVGLMGCGSNYKVTKANFDEIKGGMTLAEVEEMLGSGEVKKESGNTKTVRWESGKSYIEVIFVDNQAASKEYHGRK